MNIRIAQIALLCFFITACTVQSGHYTIIVDSASHTIIKLDESSGKAWRLDNLGYWDPIKDYY